MNDKLAKTWFYTKTVAITTGGFFVGLGAVKVIQAIRAWSSTRKKGA